MEDNNNGEINSYMHIRVRFLIIYCRVQFSSVQWLSRVRLFATLWTAAHQDSLSINSSLSLLKLLHRVNDAIQSPHPLLSPSPPAFNLSQHQGLF